MRSNTPEALWGLSLFKHIFGSAAHRANPTIRNFIKGCVRRNVPIGITLFWIVDITADVTFIFFHLFLLYPCGLLFNHVSIYIFDIAFRLFQDLVIINFFESQFVLSFLIG